MTNQSHADGATAWCFACRAPRVGVRVHPARGRNHRLGFTRAHDFDEHAAVTRSAALETKG